MEIYNAKIKFSYLGFNGFGDTLWWQIGFDYEGGKTIYTNKRCLNDLSRLSDILSVLDLHQWEDVPRKFARIKIDNDEVVAIGNLIEERWIYLC